LKNINKALNKSKKNLYIDIDGVILTKGVIPALHLEKFLNYILKKYSVFWLSSRCPETSYLISPLPLPAPLEKGNDYHEPNGTNIDIYLYCNSKHTPK